MVCAFALKRVMRARKPQWFDTLETPGPYSFHPDIQEPFQQRTKYLSLLDTDAVLTGVFTLPLTSPLFPSLPVT